MGAPQVPFRIDRNLSAAPLDFLRAVEPDLASLVVRFHALGVEEEIARGRFAPCFSAFLLVELLADHFPYPLIAEPPEVPVDSLPRREAYGEHPPLAPGFGEVKDGVDDITHIVDARGTPAVTPGS